MEADIIKAISVGPRTFQLLQRVASGAMRWHSCYHPRLVISSGSGIWLILNADHSLSQVFADLSNDLRLVVVFIGLDDGPRSPWRVTGLIEEAIAECLKELV